MSWCWSEIDHSSCSKRGRRSLERKKAWKGIYNSSSIHDFFIKASDSWQIKKKYYERKNMHDGEERSCVWAYLVPNTPVLRNDEFWWLVSANPLNPKSLVVERKYDRSERLCPSYPSFMQFCSSWSQFPFYFQHKFVGISSTWELSVKSRD